MNIPKTSHGILNSSYSSITLLLYLLSHLLHSTSSSLLFFFLFSLSFSFSSPSLSLLSSFTFTLLFLPLHCQPHRTSHLFTIVKPTHHALSMTDSCPSPLQVMGPLTQWSTLISSLTLFSHPAFYCTIPFYSTFFNTLNDTDTLSSLPQMTTSCLS